MSFNYRIIKSRHEFESIRQEWNNLLALSSSDGIFLTWEWQFSWWESYGRRLFIILVSEGKTLTAIFPFIITPKLNLRILQFIGAPHSDYLDVIIKTGFEKKIMDFFFNEFLTENRNIDMIEFDSVNERSPNFRYLSDSFPNLRFRVTTYEKNCPYITLPGSWQEYEASLTSSMRYFIKRKERKIKNKFYVNVGIAVCSEEVRIRMNNFIEQHQERWGHLHHPGAFKNEVFREFHKKVSTRLFEKGYLKLYFLDLNNIPVASYYLFQYNNCWHYYLSGFEPAYESYSPGVVLMSRAIKDAIAHGIDEFDLMRGQSEYKFKWSRNGRKNLTFFLARRTPLVYLYAVFIRLLTKFAKVIKALIPWTTKKKIRQLLPQSIIDRFDPFFRK